MKRTLAVILTIFVFHLQAQVGGRATYQFLNNVSSAKIAALGGYAIAVPDADLEMCYFNPALLDSSKDGQLDLNYTDFLSDINYGTVSYGRHIENKGIFAAGIKYLHYGSFIQADEAGVVNGEFTASEIAGYFSHARQINKNWRYGASFKLVYSNFYLYQSFGALIDAGVTYHLPQHGFMAAAVVKNLGSQIKPYTSGNYEPMPFEVQLAASHKLKHAPFRFGITAHNLQQPNIWYDSPNALSSSNTLISDTTASEFKWGDATLRHFSFSAEMLLSTNFELRFAYNHQRRQELVLRDGSKSGMNGFSFGFGLFIKRFRFDYARSIYSLAGSTNHIGISTNLGTWKRSTSEKKKQTEKK